MADPIQNTGFVSSSLPGKAAVQQAKKAVAAGSTDQLKQACRDFESIFIQQMMQQMRQTVPQNGLFSGGQAEQIYTSMLDGELSKTFAQERGLGLADVLYRQLAAIQNYEGEKRQK